MLNALDSSNFFQFNITAAQILGLNNAIYCSELINISQKASRKGRVSNGFFMLDRDYIAHRTTLDLETQYLCDASLSKVGIVEVSRESHDSVRLDYGRFVQVVTGEDYRTLGEIARKARSVTPADTREAKARKTLRNLQARVNSGNADIDVALRHWIEVTCEKSFMSGDTVDDFQKVLMQYAGVDMKKAMRIVEIATSQAWTSCTKAIASYEREQEALSRANSLPRVSNIRKGSPGNLSDEVY